MSSQIILTETQHGVFWKIIGLIRPRKVKLTLSLLIGPSFLYTTPTITMERFQLFRGSSRTQRMTKNLLKKNGSPPEPRSSQKKNNLRLPYRKRNMKRSLRLKERRERNCRGRLIKPKKKRKRSKPIWKLLRREKNRHNGKTRGLKKNRPKKKRRDWSKRSKG